jgi:beta-mannosidase
VCRSRFSGRLNDDLREALFVADLQDGQILSRQTASLFPPSILRYRPGSRLSCAWRGQVRIELACCSLARLVECALEGTDVVFSDNYFDLPAGRTVNISAPLPAGWTRPRRAALKRSFRHDSYALRTSKETQNCGFSYHKGTNLETLKKIWT